MPDRTGIDHSWDRNSDRAHLLLAQNRNKMQCDGLRNVWCSHCANNFCLAFRFQYFFPPRAFPSRLPALDLFPTYPPILLTNWNAILSILSRHITRQSDCPARLVSRVSRWTDVLSLARPFDFGISQRSRLQTSENASDESRRRRSIEHLFLILFHFNKGAWALSIFKRFPCCGRSRKKRWILTDKN